MKIKYHLLAVTFASVSSMPSLATTYPVTITDTNGQVITLNHEPKRVVLQDGRDILAMALLDRANPFTRVVAWNNNLKKSDPQTVSLLEKKWQADINKIPDMGFSDKGEVGIEQVIAQHPDVVIAQLRAKPSLDGSGATAKLKDVGIPIIYVDTFLNPVQNTEKSITLLGRVLNKESEAKEYTEFYQSHLNAIKEKTTDVQKKPLVFIEAKAGANGESCCFTHNYAGWGGMVQAVGGDNIGSHYLPGASGEISLEKVISSEPDVFIVTGAHWKNKNSIAVPFGYGVTKEEVNSGFERLKARTGFSQIKAIKNNRFYGVYHNFYNHPYNIVGMEYLATFIYPEKFTSLNSGDTYNQIISKFTTIPVQQATWGARAE